MYSNRPEIKVVGHYCHDTLVGKHGVHAALGGSAAYISAILAGLGAPFSVVSKVGPDFLYGGEIKGTPPRVIPGAGTTHFVDDYTLPGERRSVCDAVCEPIFPEDLGGSAEIAMACGIAGEVLPETLRKMKSLARVTVADAQGLLRRIDPDGRVRNIRLEETAFADCLEAVDFLKASREEARHFDLARARTLTTVIVTAGAEGCVLYTRDEELHVPAYPAEEVDSTGAGDCFLAGFAYGLLKGLDPARAARLGNRCGAIAVSQLGVPRLEGDAQAQIIFG